MTLLVAAACAAGLMLLLALGGYHRYLITGSSMTGTIDRGSIAFDKPVPTSQLAVGDVITYAPPPNAGPSGLITHRIVAMRRDRHGDVVYRTKGDANAVADPWTFTLRHATQARVAFHVPLVGYGLWPFRERGLRFLLIGLPALLLAGRLLFRLWRDAGAAARAASGAADGIEPPRDVMARAG